MTVARRTLAAVAVVAVALTGLLVGSGAAAAADGSAYVRLAHLSPDTPQVDVYVAAVADPAASFVVPGVGYGAVSQYRPVRPGSYVVSMRAAGAAPDSPPVISTTVDARPGGAYTIAGTGMNAGLGLTVLDDSVATPPGGQASVRVVNAAVSAPAVDVGPAGKPAWATGVRFASATDYRDCPLGDWTLTVTSGGRPATTLPVKLAANSSYTVLLVDQNGALAAQVYRDTTGPGVVPVGGVNTGMGGTAGVGFGLAAILGALVAALAGGLLTRRIGRRVRL
jgi:Domain of unknown function (DUF4397)